MEKLARELKRLRENKALPQEAVAEGIHLSQTGYLHYEKGRVIPPLYRLQALALFHCCNVLSLIRCLPRKKRLAYERQLRAQGPKDLHSPTPVGSAAPLGEQGRMYRLEQKIDAVYAIVRQKLGGGGGVSKPILGPSHLVHLVLAASTRHLNA